MYLITLELLPLKHSQGSVSATSLINVSTNIIMYIIQLVYMYPSLQSGAYSVPLIIAATNGHAQTVERLLEGGALINYQRPVCNTIITIVYIDITEGSPNDFDYSKCV